MTPEQPYVHGTSPREQARLGLMNDILNTGALRALEVTHGEKILDLGSGLGQLSRAMARAAGPRGKVIAVERSPDQIREAERLARDAREAGLVEFRQGDATAPPLRDEEWGTFDLAHTRFLLEHLAKPVDLVRVMVRAVAPGGRIVLEDEDHEILRLWPEPEDFTPVWRAYIRSYEARGTDPSVGRRLVSLLHEAGGQACRSDWIFFGGCAGEVRFDPLVENLARILEGAEGTIAATGLAPASQVRSAVTALRAWRERPDAALWYAVACVEGVRPGA